MREHLFRKCAAASAFHLTLYRIDANISVMKQFEEYARYYNLFYSDKDYSGEAKTVDHLIKKYGSYTGSNTPLSLLNLGCGTGRHDRELSRLGYNTKGVDLSKEMIDIAVKNYGTDQVQFDVGDIRSYSDKVSYDICTSLFHVISYQNSNEDLTAAFATANRALKENGLFIFDCWYGPGVLSDKPAVRIKRVEDRDKIFIRHAVPDVFPEQDLVYVNYEVIVIDKTSGISESFTESHHMRYLFTPEIKLMLELNGFELICCLDCNTLDDVTFDSWTAYFIARKMRNI